MDVFGALADPVRRSLLRELADRGSVRVVDLATDREISRPAISRHLRVLGEAGLVRADDVGRERHYRLDHEPLGEVTAFVAELHAPTGTAPVTPSMLDALDLEVRRVGRDRTSASRADTDTTTTEETA